MDEPAPTGFRECRGRSDEVTPALSDYWADDRGGERNSCDIGKPEVPLIYHTACRIALSACVRKEIRMPKRSGCSNLTFPSRLMASTIVKT